VVEDAPPKPRYQSHRDLGIETVAYRGPLERMATHAHAQHQLTLYVGGPRRFQIAQRGFSGGVRTSVIIQAGEPHSSHPVGDPVVTLRTFYLEESLVSEVAASLWGGTGTVAFGDPLIDDARTVARLYAAHRALDERHPDCEEKTYLALEQLVRRFAAPTGPARRAGAAETSLSTVRAMLDDRATESVGLGELAQAAGLSRFHLIRAFRRRYGVTPLAYHRHQRIERARAVLRAGRSLAEAAADAGFADQSHLGRSFRAVMGATPGEYRDSYRRALR
jgi:AraC-like DNA-binding protein